MHYLSSCWGGVSVFRFVAVSRADVEIQSDHPATSRFAQRCAGAAVPMGRISPHALISATSKQYEDAVGASLK